MRLRSVQISNFRNISGMRIFLHPEANYIIGDNNIGKTNFLELLYAVFSMTPFGEGDFSDPGKPVGIALEFDSPEGTSSVNFTQDRPDSMPECSDCQGRPFDTRVMRCAPVGDPDDGARFAGNRAPGESRASLLAARARESVFGALISLGSDMPAGAVSAIVCLDEPEAHLDPYMQRSLISSYRRILAGEDGLFSERLSSLGVTSFTGQLIVVTHSTDPLIGDYRNLIRFYRSGGRTAVVCGPDPDLHVPRENEKHLIMRFPEIKEAFYARCAILIEGETEYGCLPAFASLAGVDLDGRGVCVINARGEGSIRPLRRLLGLFGVESVAVYDGDMRGRHGKTAGDYFTDQQCFEIEMTRAMADHGPDGLCMRIAQEADPKAGDTRISASYLAKGFRKLGLDSSGFTPVRLRDVVESHPLFAQIFAAWFMNHKGVILGRIIGQAVTPDLIPECYLEALAAASSATGAR